MQGAVNAVLLALIFILTVKNGRESLVGYILESLRAAYIASVRIDLQ